MVRGECTDLDYNRDINILFVKLHLLDPTLVMPAYHHLQKGVFSIKVVLHFVLFSTDLGLCSHMCNLPPVICKPDFFISEVKRTIFIYLNTNADP